MTSGIDGTRRPHGRTVRCPGGYQAYVPSPLPPPIAWDGDLVAALSRADHAMGRLAGEGRLMPNPHLFIRSFLQREAVLSSRIEGTQTTPWASCLPHRLGQASSGVLRICARLPTTSSRWSTAYSA